jgi:hypothetical protein
MRSGIMRWIKETFDEAEFEGVKVKFKEELRKDWREEYVPPHGI